MDIVGIETSGHKLDTGVFFYLVHGLGNGEPVIPTEVVRERVRDLRRRVATQYKEGGGVSSYIISQPGSVAVQSDSPLTSGQSEVFLLQGLRQHSSLLPGPGQCRTESPQRSPPMSSFLSAPAPLVLPPGGCGSLHSVGPEDVEEGRHDVVHHYVPHGSGGQHHDLVVMMTLSA